MTKKREESDDGPIKKMIEELSSVKKLLILQLIQNGATSEQISLVLKTKNINPSNISDSFPIKKLHRKETKK